MKEDIDFSQFLRKKSQYEDFYQFRRPEKSDLSEKTGKSFITGAGSAVLSAPRTLTGLLKHGSQSLARKGQELAEKEGRKISPEEAKFTEYATKILGWPEDVLEKLGFPTYQEVSDWHRSKIGQEEDRSDIEKGFETAGSLLGGSLLTPTASLSTPARLASTGLSALGAGTAAALGGEEGEQISAAIGLPAIVDLINTVKSGRLSPSQAQKIMYNELKSMGLSEGEITPILQSSFKNKTLGAIAKTTDRAYRSIEASESALGDLYDKLKEKTSNLPSASADQTEKLLLKFDKISKNLKKSKIPGPDKESAIQKIDDMISRIENEGISADEIIDSWQDINRSVNWNSFKGGKKSLNALKGPFEELLKEVSPKDHKTFITLNKAWGRLQDTASKVSPSQYANLVKLGDIGVFLKGLYDLSLTGNPKTLAFMGAKEGARMLATEMLTNPRLNNLMNKTLAAGTKGTKIAIQKAVRDFEKGLREFPEIHDAIDFEEFISE